MGNIRTANVYEKRLKDLQFGEALDKSKLSLWTEEESMKFNEAVRLHSKNYQKITEHLGTKTRH